MKKTTLLQSDLSYVIATMGHLDTLVIAEEVRERNPKFLAEVQALLPDVQMEFVSHAEFKTRTVSARAVVRTGEFAPYANVILVSGVVF